MKIIVKKTFAGYFILLLLVQFVTVSAQNKVLDGNFEDNTPFTDAVDIANKYQTFTPAKPMTYWRVLANSVDKDNKAFLGMGCPPGGYDHHIDLNPAGAISQTIRGLVIGNRYSFSFYTSVHQFVMAYCTASGTTSMKAEIKVGTGTTLLSEILVLNKADVAWGKRSYSFIATADSVELVLSGEGSCNGTGGVLIDEIEIVYEDADPCVPYQHFAYAGKDTMYCSSGDSTSIQLQASGGVSYRWAPTAAFSNPAQAVVTTKITQPSTFIVTVTNDDGCVDKDTVFIDVHANPLVQVSPDHIAGCSGDTVALHASGSVHYNWQPLTGLTRNGAPDTKVVIAGSELYTVEGTNADGCKGRDTFTVSMYPGPVLTLSADKTTLDCRNNSVLLQASGALTYSWQPATYCKEPLRDITMATPGQTTMFTVTGKNEQGCAAMDSILINVEGSSSVTVPNAFTPNGDNLNEAIGIRDLCDFVLEEFSIYHRSGKQVFHTANVLELWDGTINGERCNTGVYMYFVRGHNRKGEKITHKGDITLVR